MVSPLVEVLNLELNYGKQKVVDDVSFQLDQGRILALIGPNGAGKSSIMRIMAGLVKAEKGHLLVNGELLASDVDIHYQAGFFIEGPDFYKNLTARQNLFLLKKIKNSKQDIDALLKLVGLDYAAKKKVGKFSRGMKQRLGVAQALIGDPSVLVLDEPFNGLDPEVKQFLMNLIRKLANEEGKAVLVSSHILSDLEMLADDFVLLSEGKVHASGKLSDYKNERHTVRFWFEKQPDEIFLQKIANGKMMSEDPWCWETRLSTAETSEAVGKWAATGICPFEIQRADLLHSKYMEIIK